MTSAHRRLRKCRRSCLTQLQCAPVSGIVTISPAEARRRLVAHLGLTRYSGRGGKAVRRVLERLRCIQLDPLDVIGTNADLVMMARVDGARRGDVWRHLFPGHAFEHFAKERCLLPSTAFPRYRDRGHMVETPWWRHGEREQRVSASVLRMVLKEVQQHGPVAATKLSDHGQVEPMDWSGWKGTAKATTMALELLWTRCDIVVCGRTASGAKLYDVPRRALGAVADEAVKGDFERWALNDRVHAAGLLSRASGSHWSMLSSVRTSDVPDSMIANGELVEVTIEGSPRRYLAAPTFLSRRLGSYDHRVRILGPLDPLLWDRNLVRAAFDFDYVWEVYKPEHLRKWGWYVCPLLFEDRLIGRLDARIKDDELVVRKLWLDEDVDPMLVRESLEQHAVACGCRRVRHRRPSANLARSLKIRL